MMMKRFFAAGVLMVMAMVLIYSCSIKGKVNTWQPPASEFAFVEFYETQEGRAIEGEAPPGMRIDGPTYSYRDDAQEINSFYNNEINKDSLVLLLGRGVILRGTRGGGMHSRLVPAYTIPFSMDALTVNKLNAEGVSLKWNDNDIKLAPGESWVDSKSKIDTLVNHEGNRAIIENTTTYTLRFHGFIKKEKLIVQQSN